MPPPVGDHAQRGCVRTSGLLVQFAERPDPSGARNAGEAKQRDAVQPDLDLDLVHPEQWRDGSRGVVNVFRFQEDVRDL